MLVNFIELTFNSNSPIEVSHNFVRRNSTCKEIEIIFVKLQNKNFHTYRKRCLWHGMSTSGFSTAILRNFSIHHSRIRYKIVMTWHISLARVIKDIKSKILWACQYFRTKDYNII